MKILIIAPALMLLTFSALGQSNPASQQKIEQILGQLTLEEKVSMCSGAVPQMAFRGVERLGIPNVQCTDGPRGATRGQSTVFPTGLSFGASWNPALVEEAGKVIGAETRAKGIGVLLGPANNILRDPLNGRFFEYFTEDPYLNSKITVANVVGIQSQGVAASLKHYACNNREDNRNFYMSMVDERTLHEIYLPAYKAAVQDGKVWSIMTSANGVNNEFVSDSKKMLTDILKNTWGFDGFVITDWLQTRSTEKAALAGLDISMPGGENCGFGAPLLAAVKEGRIPMSVIDDKVRRILRIYGRIGVLDGNFSKSGSVLNTAKNQAVARKLAEEGIVLLKNERNTLPLNAEKISNVLIIGPNADKKLCFPGAGGSSGGSPAYEITALKGVSDLLGTAKVKYLTSEDLGGFQLIPDDAIRNTGGGKGFKADYFVKDLDKAVLSRIDPTVDFMWEMKSPHPSIDPAKFIKAHYEGSLIPPIDGKYTVRMIVNGIAYLYQGNGASKKQLAFADSQQTLRVANASIQLKKGEPFDISIDYEKLPGDAAIRLEWELPDAPADKLALVDSVARNADAVIYVGGIDHSMDTEGRDRKDMNFPGAQENIIKRLAKLNQNFITVLINGSPMELGGWLAHVPAVVEAWYPGMEGGRAIADVLFGKANPSGKLPFSWPKRLGDAPSKVLATETNEVINYTDSLMVGYRYYDTKNVKPEFPFGYGLSYTSFKYGQVNAIVNKDKVNITFDLTNTGKMSGSEVVQVYIKPLNPKVKRPIHELKQFKKVSLNAGECRKISLTLDREAFAYYSVDKGIWKVDDSKYVIEVAANSQKVLSSATIRYR